MSREGKTPVKPGPLLQGGGLRLTPAGRLAEEPSEQKHQREASAEVPGETRERIERQVKTARTRIAELAERHQGEALNSIHHLMGLEMLEYAYWQLDGSKSPGEDGQSKADYGRNLEENLKGLLERVRTRTYKAPPARRVEIPKGDGETRPLGILNIEDKVLQKGYVTLVEPILEREFYDFSYGFRSGKNQHQAIKELDRGIGREGVYVIDLDIRKYFDTIPKGKLQEVLGRRIKDGVLSQLVVGWLNAGIMREGQWEATEAGTPQGANVSPMLANLYLHEALDDWYVVEVQPRLRGRSGMVRFADDAVLYFENREDAERVLEVLPKRLAKYGLSLHPDKTKLLEFRSPEKGGKGKSTFDFLGFTFYWGKTRKGRSIVKLKTARKKFTAKLTAIYQWCREHRHQGWREQHRTLSAKLRGHIQYYGVSHNSRHVERFIRQVKRAWWKWLNRRGGKPMPLKKLQRLLKEYPLPRARIVHRLF